MNIPIPEMRLETVVCADGRIHCYLITPRGVSFLGAVG